MGFLEGLGLGLEVAEGVSVAAVPDGPTHGLRAPRTEPDLLLARGEGGLGAREVGNCGFLRRRRDWRNDFADAEL